jgi:uncharacterized membrane protein YcaP (DUF421 family)
MDSIVRAFTVYLFMLVLFRLSGRRTLSHITTFDLVLTLLISEAVQDALIGADNSMTNAFLLVTTLAGLDILLSYLTHRSKAFARFVEGIPIIGVDNGKFVKHAMDKERVSEVEIMAAARELHGLERLDQVKYAVVEHGGRITIVPKNGGD